MNLVLSVKNRNARQQCHARFYYVQERGDIQEVPGSYPEHPFDRGFHFLLSIILLIGT